MKRAWPWMATTLAVTLVIGGLAWWVDNQHEWADKRRVAPAAVLGAVPNPDFAPSGSGRRNAAPGWLDQERRRPGADDLPPVARWIRLGPVSGYVRQTVVSCGQTVELHLSSGKHPAMAQVAALRVGSYGSKPLRKVWQSAPIRVEPGAEAMSPGARVTVMARWPVSLRIPVTSSWPPGFCLLRLSRVGTRNQDSYVPLVVRSSGDRAPRLVVASDLTWLAYNSYGGTSLYRGPGKNTKESVAARAYRAATDRPLRASGLAQMFTMEVALARFLDDHDLVADWTTDSSFDAEPAQVKGYNSIVLPGHSEYWTKVMYDALEGAVGNGTNLAVLGANEIYWQARVHRGPKGRMVGMTVFKDDQLDPVVDRSLTTVKWGSDLLDRDPAALTGAGYAGSETFGDLQVVSTPAWMFGKLRIAPNTVLVGAVGNEANAVEPPGGKSPASVQTILSGEVPKGSTGRKVRVTTSYYAAASGAGVFNAGTTRWVCGAVRSCPDHQPAPGTGQVLSTITANVLVAFGTARWGARRDLSR